jgi:HEAT repeat protein
MIINSPLLSRFSRFFPQDIRKNNTTETVPGKVNSPIPRMGGCRITMGDTELPVPDVGSPRDPTVEELDVRDEQRKKQVLGYIALLKDPNLTFRWKAAEAMGTIGDSSAIEPLLEALKDPFVDVQWLAAKSLGRIGDSRCVEPLINALKSDDKWLRAGAAWGLGKLKDPRATEPLINLLKDKKKTVRKNAAWALGYIGDERAVPELEGLLQDPDKEVRDTSRKALESIVREKEKRAVMTMPAE